MKIGCEISTHLTVEGTTKKPDFFARFESGASVILEAKVAGNESDKKRKRGVTLGAIYSAINEKVSSPYFWITLGPIGTEETLPNPRNLVAFIKQMIRQLEFARKSHPTIGIGHALPTFVFHGKNYFREITAIAKGPEFAGRTGVRTLAGFPGESRWGDGSEALQSAIAAKTTKYGDPKTPFIIALNATSSWGNSREEVVRALFGSADGTLSGLFQPEKNRRVSAVLVTTVHPWSMHVAPLCLYHNPYASRPCVGFGWQFTEAFYLKGKVQWFDGRSAAGLLDLGHW